MDVGVYEHNEIGRLSSEQESLSTHVLKMYRIQSSVIYRAKESLCFVWVGYELVAHTAADKRHYCNYSRRLHPVTVMTTDRRFKLHKTHRRVPALSESNIVVCSNRQLDLVSI